MRNVSDKVVDKIKTHTLRSMTFFFFFENRAFYEKMWKNILERGMPQLTKWRVRIAFWICHSCQYGACALHAGYVGLQIHAQVVLYLLLFLCNNSRAVVLRFTFLTCLVLHL